MRSIEKDAPVVTLSGHSLLSTLLYLFLLPDFFVTLIFSIFLSFASSLYIRFSRTVTMLSSLSYHEIFLFIWCNSPVSCWADGRTPLTFVCKFQPAAETGDVRLFFSFLLLWRRLLHISFSARQMRFFSTPTHTSVERRLISLPLSFSISCFLMDYPTLSYLSVPRRVINDDGTIPPAKILFLHPFFPLFSEHVDDEWHTRCCFARLVYDTRRRKSLAYFFFSSSSLLRFDFFFRMRITNLFSRCRGDF